MAGEAKIALEGNLTADPQIRGKGDNKFVTFSVAVTPRKKDGDEWIDGDAAFYDCSTGNKMLMEGIMNSLAKGNRVTVTGSLSPQEWEGGINLRVFIDSIGASMLFDDVEMSKRQRKSTKRRSGDDEDEAPRRKSTKRRDEDEYDDDEPARPARQRRRSRSASDDDPWA